MPVAAPESDDGAVSELDGLLPLSSHPLHRPVREGHGQRAVPGARLVHSKSEVLLRPALLCHKEIKTRL